MFNKIFSILYNAYGPQHWWPAETPFEVCVGAILTQNTSWKNVEKAIASLKDRNLLHPKKIYSIPQNRLERLIKCSGFYKQKAERIKLFCGTLAKYNFSLEKMFRKPLPALRQELLNIKGIGPETADSIILYASEKPVFVIDAYTRRIFSRLGLINENATYEDIQNLFHRSLKLDILLFKEYHALIVEHAKRHCRKQPLCAGCVLSGLCKDRVFKF